MVDEEQKLSLVLCTTVVDTACVICAFVVVVVVVVVDDVVVVVCGEVGCGAHAPAAMCVESMMQNEAKYEYLKMKKK
jgi:hypothetical protein